MRIQALVMGLLYLAIMNSASANSATPCEDVIRRYGERGFSGAVLVKKGVEIKCQGATGLDFAMSAESTLPLSVDDRFLIGSVTKQFTAAGILVLLDQGFLSLGDPLDKFLPGWPGGKRINVHHLLTHTSGIGDFTGTREFRKLCVTRFTSLDPLLRIVRKLKPSFSPGARWNYSNSNYALLSMIIEKVSGKTWGDFMNTEVFARAGLRETQFRAERGPLVVTGHSIGHSSEPRPIRAVEYLERGWANGAGGLESTVADLARWNEALFGGRVLSPSSLELMTKAHAVTDDGAKYGYGLFRKTFKKTGDVMIYHTGGIPGFASIDVNIPAKNLSVVVLSNVLDGRRVVELSDSLLELVLTKMRDESH